MEDVVAGRQQQQTQQQYRDVAREVGVLEYREDEYDIPTFLRKQAD